MANYLKATDFAAKDALLTGDPNKIVKGTEINDEFDSIQTAVNSKANSSSPTFTGTPAAPTAAIGTNTTQVATTAFVAAALYPVGSIYLSTLATSPATLFGFGTWVAFGAGKVLVGQDTGDAAFDVLEETGGSKDATLPSHTHALTDPGHKHEQYGISTLSGNGYGYTAQVVGPYTWPNGQSPSLNDNMQNADTGITIDTVGSSATNANLQPYVVVKMWKRTA
jgi:hypothetical protein